MSVHVGQDADDPRTALDALLDTRGVLEATPECLIVAEVDGRIVYANHRVEALSGYTLDELVDRPVGDLVAGPVPLETAPSAEPLEGACRRKDGEIVPVEIHLGAVDGA